MKTKMVFRYNVFILRNNKKIPALLVKDYAKRKLTLMFKDKKYEIDFRMNWFSVLRALDKIANQNGYKILCNGTSKNVGVIGLIVTMADGSLCYVRDPKAGREENKQKKVETLEYSDWNEYATEEEQRISFFGKTFTELIDKGWDAAQRDLKKVRKEKKGKNE